MPRKKGSPNHDLKSARLLKSLSQEDVADAIGTDPSKVAEWELGYSKPRIYTQRKLCALFDKTPNELGFLTEKPLPKLFDPFTPSPIQGFVGRHELLELLKKRLFGSQNVVLSALHGLPGVGKTSIAVRLAYDPDVQMHFSDGVLWAGVGRWDSNHRENIREILRRWGRLLGLGEVEMTKLSSDDQAWIMAIRKAIGKRRMLLILDDIWHIEHGEALRVGGPFCQYLITTRRPHIIARFADEERMLVPELDEADSVTLLAHFVPHLVKDEPEEIQKLVQAVGGLPLALKLMGANLSSQTYFHQHRRIDNALKKLRGAEERLQLQEGRGEQDRHPSLPDKEFISLQTVIGISDEALQENERQVLRALSIFPPKPNTFSEEAALEIAITSRETLGHLTDVWLVEVGTQDRYTLHQTVADYAKMRRTDETVGKRMADYFAQFADATSKASERALEVDEININESLKIAYRNGYNELVMQICMEMQYFWRNGGRRSTSLEYLPWGIEAAGMIQTHKGRLSEATLAYTYGQILFQMGRANDASEYYRKSLAIYQELGDKKNEGVVLAALGRLELSLGHMDKAEEYCQQALTIHRAMKDRKEESVDISSLGQVALGCRQFEKAEEYCQRALALRREMGDQRGERIDLISLGIIAVERRQFETAENYFQQALSLSKTGKEADRRGEAASLRFLGQASLALGQLRDDEEAHNRLNQAEKYLTEALSMHREVLDQEGEGNALSFLGDLAIIRAEELYRESLKIFRNGGQNRYTADALMLLGSFLIKARDKQEEGCSMLLEAAQLYEQMGIYNAEMELPSARKAWEIAQRLGCSRKESLPSEVNYE
jgi:tetratricopeptide (TPR) repeat protein/transcriptional regulator with XRE-family HTH domain